MILLALGFLLLLIERRGKRALLQQGTSPQLLPLNMSDNNSNPVSPPLSVEGGDAATGELSKKFQAELNLNGSGGESSENFQDAQESSNNGDEGDSAVTDFEDSDIGTSMPPAPSFKSVMLQFLKTFATSGTDLFSISSPAIMCNGISVLEYCAHYCDHPEILAAIAKGESPLDRMLVVVQWYLSGLFGSYASRSTSSGFERKPFNPILGERFFAEWPDEGYGTTEMIAEQVSHHPPTTAFYLRNKSAGVHVNAFSTQKTRFMGTYIKAEQQGNVFVYLEKFNEEYMMTLPEIYVRGLLTGAPFIELCGDVAFVSSSGYGVKMRFIPKPWFSGEYDQVEAVIFDTRTGKIHYDVWGKWSNSIFFDEHDEESEKRCHFRKRKNASGYGYESSTPSSAQTGEVYSSLVENHTRKGPTLFNPEMMPKIPFTVKPISKQGDLESRRVWHPVAKALQKADYESANAAKNKIENEQRALRRERAQNNETWLPVFFNYEPYCFMPNVHKENDHLEEILANLISEAPKMLVTKDEPPLNEEEEEVSSSTPSSIHSISSPLSASSEASSSSGLSSPVSSTQKKPKHGYKGRWVYKEFAKVHVKQ